MVKKRRVMTYVDPVLFKFLRLEAAERDSNITSLLDEMLRARYADAGVTQVLDTMMEERREREVENGAR